MGRVVNRMRAVHPGEVLREEYLADNDLKTLATRHDIARKVSPREGAPA